MQLRKWIASVAAVWLCGCHGPAPSTPDASVQTGNQADLEPQSIAFDQAWVGFSNDQTLSFTLNGQPVQKLSLFVPEMTSAAQFFAVAMPPDGSAPYLRVIPSEAEDISTSLTVTADGQVFDVPVQVHAVAPPACDQPDMPCQQSTFDPKSGSCVNGPVPDGTTCGDAVCGDHQHLCRQGQCDLVNAPVPIPACDVGSATGVQPTWTVLLDSPPLIDPVVDADGNIYLLERASFDDMEVDLVSLTPAGGERWRELFFPCDPKSTWQLLLQDDSILVGRPCPTPGVESRRLKDGTTLWQDSLALGTLVAAGKGQLAAPLSDINGVLLGFESIQATDGTLQELLALPNGASDATSASLVTDGQLGLFGTYTQGNQTTAFGATGTTAFQWQNAFPGNANVLATDGQHIVLSNGQLLGAGNGQVAGTIPDTALVNAAVMAGNQTYAAVQSTLPGCTNAFVESIDPTTGFPGWRCQLAAPTATSLWLTKSGGVGVAGAFGAEPVAVAIYDNAGHLVSAVKPVLSDPLSKVQTWTFVGNQRLLAVATNSATAQVSLAAFDVSAADLADHGWVMAGGNPRRTGAPQ